MRRQTGAPLGAPPLADNAARAANASSSYREAMHANRGIGRPSVTQPSGLGAFLDKAGEIRITGNTFECKERIKALGGRWDKPTKAWVLDLPLAPEAEAFLAQADELGLHLDRIESVGLPGALPTPPKEPPAVQSVPLSPSERAKVLDKVRKLQALGTSPNPFEAEQARASAEQILAKHGLTQADLDGTRNSAGGARVSDRDVFDAFGDGIFRDLFRQWGESK